MKGLSLCPPRLPVSLCGKNFLHFAEKITPPYDLSYMTTKLLVFLALCTGSESNGECFLTWRRRDAGCSRHSCSHNLKPHRTKTFKLSRDPKFLEKLTDVL